MNDYLLVSLNTFTLNKNVYLVRQNSVNTLGEFLLDDLGKKLVDMSLTHSVNKIKIDGGAYAERLIYEIKKEEMKLYSTNNLEIEVI